jgi:hypothetical protein
MPVNWFRRPNFRSYRLQVSAMIAFGVDEVASFQLAVIMLRSGTFTTLGLDAI